jgi:hypothetical protein
MGPLRKLSPDGDYLYLFNASIIPRLRPQTAASRSLLKAFLTDIAKTEARGLASVTVSEDGARICQVLGLAYRGDMIFEGEAEQVYAARFDTATQVRPRPTRRRGPGG